MSDPADPPEPVPPPDGLAQAVLQHGSEAVATVDSAGVVQWANARFTALTGLGPQASITTLCTGEPPFDASHLAIQAALHGAALQNAALTCRGAHGSPLHLRATVVPLPDRQVWLLRDDTAAVQAARYAEQGAEQLRAVQRFGRLGLWERDIASGQGQWDEQVFRFWGLDPAGGTPGIEAANSRIHPADRDKVKLTGQDVRAGHHTARFRVIRSDGSVRWLHAQWEVKAGADGRPARALGVVMDDTQAFETAHSLGEAHAQLHLAEELANIAIWRYDLRTERVIYSTKARELLGRARREEGYSIQEVRDLIHPDDRPSTAAASAQALKGDKPVDVQARYLHSDGSWRHLLTRRAVERSHDGTPQAVIVVALDVTESRRAAQALRHADERAALAARSAGIGTWEYSMHDGSERWDEQMFHLRGIPLEPTPPPRERRLAMVHPDDRLNTVDAWDDVLTRHEPGVYEFRVVWPDGTLHWLASRSMVVFDDQGKAERRVGVNWDITENKNVEVARQDKALAERASRAKSEFLSRISHELRTPLNAVLGFTQLLQLDAAQGAPASQIERLGHVRSAGEHLLALINDMLDLSGLEAGELRVDLKPVDLARLLQDTLSMMAPLAEQHRVSLRADGLAGHAHADAQRLRQVMVNLLSNAIKYNRSDGVVQVSAELVGPWVEVHVSDSGRGLTRLQIEHLFEPFNRLGLERSGIAGTGIGLVIVKSLVQSMQGTVSVRSEPGQGTRFSLRLPSCDAAAEAVPANLAGEPALPLPAAASRPFDATEPRVRGRLLYIEDNAVNVLLVQELVHSVPGLALESEATGQAGVARALQTQPDLILVDMQLPDFDGHEVLRRLRADPRTAAIDCVALSANAMPDDIARARAAGFADYWTKPIDFRSFIAALARRFPA